MSRTLFVGCDVSAETNAFYLMEHKGSPLATKTFANTLSGAQGLESWSV